MLGGDHAVVGGEGVRRSGEKEENEEPQAVLRC